MNEKINAIVSEMFGYPAKVSVDRMDAGAICVMVDVSDRDYYIGNSVFRKAQELGLRIHDASMTCKDRIGMTITFARFVKEPLMPTDWLTELLFPEYIDDNYELV